VELDYKPRGFFKHQNKGVVTIMKKPALRIILALVALCLSAVSCTTHDSNRPICVDNYCDTIRVACVGDSITYGSSIKFRIRDCYPAQLDRMLGDKWETRNFGVGGATMLKKGDKPYWKQQAFEDALAFNPYVVIIKLGTNDTKPQNWKFRKEFAADYIGMIDHFANLPNNPRIWICYPVPAYPARWGISDSRIKNEVVPLIEQVARKKHVPVIDLYEPLSNKPELFPDLIHPNAEGARLIAKEIYKALTGLEWTDKKSEIMPQVLIIGDSISIGYFNPVKQLLKGRAIVHHNPGNAQHTANGLKRLQEWLGETQWDVIHFNHGLHDLKYVDEQGKNTSVDKGRQQIPIDQYEKNLEELVRELKKTGAKLIFANTTPVPEGTGIRVKGDAKRYNLVAERIMKKHGILINDLYSFALPRLEEIQRKQNVHFNERGSNLLAEQVANIILKAIEGQ
jgi:lysophospholipase L1-like esterase